VQAGRVSQLAEHPVSDTRVPRFALTEWRSSYGLVAGVTSRQGGFDLGLTSRDPAGAEERWQSLRTAFSPSFSTIVVSRQVHGTALARAGARADGLRILDGFDGHVTLEPGVLLAVTVADCVPVYLAEPASGAVALIHAGWRGVAAGILERGLAELEAVSKAPAADIVMHCGVAICGECYEVGPEVAEAVLGSRPNGPDRLDLRAALAERAWGLGLRTITVSPHCTAHGRDAFFSHRGSGGMDGRMAAYLGRPMP
jgi:YfiH family protein